jgi:hypothetical protein
MRSFFVTSEFGVVVVVDGCFVVSSKLVILPRATFGNIIAS